jgi:hypothetical protein
VIHWLEFLDALARLWQPGGDAALRACTPHVSIAQEMRLRSAELEETMDTVRTGKKNGYEIHVKVVRVHPGKRVKRAASALDDGYVPLVEIARGGESYAQWHRPMCCKSGTAAMRPRTTHSHMRRDGWSAAHSMGRHRVPMAA